MSRRRTERVAPKPAFNPANDHCPECRAQFPDLKLVLRSHLVKQCPECGHRWNEENLNPLRELTHQGSCC